MQNAKVQRWITVVKVRDHYEVQVHGEFYCSCDNLAEVVEEVNALVYEEETV